MSTFAQAGKGTVLIACSQTNTSKQIGASQTLLTPPSDNLTVRLYNSGPNTVALHFSPAADTAVYPTDSNALYSMVLAAGATETFDLSDNFINAICKTGETANLFATVGQGD